MEEINSFQYDGKIDIKNLNEFKDDFIKYLLDNNCIELEPDKKAYKIIWPFHVCVVKREKETWGY